jgi:hypothetical protein
MEKKSTWQVLSAIDCNKFTEKKNGLTYLSWAHAWGVLKENYPDANYKVISYEGKPYLFDQDLGYLVTTEVTIDGETIPMNLPVMDGANKAQKNVGYKITTRFGEKSVEPATMFDINTAIMRCLTKNLAMFGLGHYIYAGEDLPVGATEEVKSVKTEEVLGLEQQINNCATTEELKKLFDAQTNPSTEVKDLFTKKKISLKK